MTSYRAFYDLVRQFHIAKNQKFVNIRVVLNMKFEVALNSRDRMSFLASCRPLFRPNTTPTLPLAAKRRGGRANHRPLVMCPGVRGRPYSDGFRPRFSPIVERRAAFPTASLANDG